MPKIVKSISLDERTAPIADEKSNFSAWVREKLLNEIAYTIPCTFFTVHHLDRRGVQIQEDYYTEDGQKMKRKVVTEEICNGMKRPHCITCYPEGPPEQEDWRHYTRRAIDKEELLRRASLRWKWRTDALARDEGSKNQENVPQMGGKQVKRAYVRRLLTWIWSFIW